MDSTFFKDFIKEQSLKEIHDEFAETRVELSYFIQETRRNLSELEDRINKLHDIY